MLVLKSRLNWADLPHVGLDSVHGGTPFLRDSGGIWVKGQNAGEMFNPEDGSVITGVAGNYPIAVLDAAVVPGRLVPPDYLNV